MVRYFYKWIPFVILGTVVILSLPWLGGIVALLVVLAVVAALAWAIFFVPYMAGRALSRRWHRRTGANHHAAANVSARSLAEPVVHISLEGRKD
jgi:hypothetical protein